MVYFLWSYSKCLSLKHSKEYFVPRTDPDGSARGNVHTIFSELSPTQMQGKLVLFSAISPKIGCEADYKEARSFIIALKFLYHFPALTGVSSLVTVGYLTSPCIFVLHHSWKNRLILLRSRQSSMLDTRRMKWSYKENDIQRPNPPTKNSASLTF